MTAKDIIAIISSVAGFLFTVLIPTFVVMINRIKAAKSAKTEAEKQEALNDLKQLAQGFIVEAENLYKDIDAIVKEKGKTCGAVKKDSVMTKIQDACLMKGIAFDKDFWSAEIDDLVTMTRKVNAK